MSQNPQGNKERDIYRDTLLRYCGYANEVGESFRRQIGAKWVAATYGAATLYVLADTQDKARKAYRENSLDPKRTSRTVFAAADVLVWQMLASVMIPGFTINRVCWLTHRLLKSQTKLKPTVMDYATTAVGLSAIPVIIHPIDHFVDFLLDNTIRKLKP